MTAEVAQTGEELQNVPAHSRFDIMNVIVEKVTGTVKWFSVRRHYGFIQRDDNKEDVFVHRTAIAASRSRYPTLRSGESVEFAVVETASGINAVSVTGPNGQRVQGARFFRHPKLDVGVDEQPKLNDATQASGDVEGTRQRGSPRRVRRGRKTFRPSQNETGDGEDVGGERGEDNFGDVEGSRLTRQPPPRRFREGTRGRGNQRSVGIRQQVNGEEGTAPFNHEEGFKSRQPQGLRRAVGGRFRRGGGGGRMRRGGGMRDGEVHGQNTIEGEHDEGIEKKMENMALNAVDVALEKFEEVVTEKETVNNDSSSLCVETSGATE